jgi:hypothetical protein
MSMRQDTLVKIEQFNNYFRTEDGSFPETIVRNDIRDLHEAGHIPWPRWIFKPENKVPGQRGVYRYVNPLGDAKVSAAPTMAAKAEPAPAPAMTPPAEVVPINNTAATLRSASGGFAENLIPTKDALFVPFGHYKVVESVIKSNRFYPVFVTGLSGNGKTFMIEQACARANRPLIRVNLTVETDEDDLIGGFRLVDGETVFFKGPVIRAMEQGAILLLDEIDLANPAKILCLQSIAEGSGYFIKKTGEFIEPAAGFNILATANTKGKGSNDGRFVGTNVMNEAFLERFPITIEQEYPSEAIEKRILNKVFDSLGVENDGFVEKLVSWASVVRASYFDDAVEEIISTRRLVHIAGAYQIFDNKMKAIQLCVNRFDQETKEVFLELYTKVDETVSLDGESDSSETEETASTTPADNMPF